MGSTQFVGWAQRGLVRACPPSDRARGHGAKRAPLPTLRGITLLALAFVAASTAAAQNAPLVKVRVGYDGFSMTSAPMYYATQKGIFKQFGLDVTPLFVEGGSVLTRAVVGGSVDIAQNGYTPAAAAAVQGADIVFIGGISNTLPFQLVVKSAVTQAAQLKGQAIAISRYGSSTDQAAEFALKHLGLTRNDVRILQLGAPATRIAATMSGQIAGTMEQYPDTAEMAKMGFHVLVDVTDIAGDYPNTSYVTSRAFLKKNPEVVKRFFMAMATAIHAFKTHPADAITLSRAFLSVKDEASVKAAYDAYRNVYPDIPRPTLAGIALVLKELAANEPKAKAVKPESVVDTSAIDALENEGFFKTLLASGP